MRAFFFLGLVVVLFAAGCSSRDDYLPQPRPSIDEEVEEAPPQKPASPTGNPAAQTSTEVASETPTPQPQGKRDASFSAAGKDAPSKSNASADELAAQPLPHAPKQSLSPEERRARSTQNLYQISRALDAYLREYKRFPGAIYDRAGRPCLSWRVRLLPALGYEDLAEQFRPTEPWDSPHNRQLLAKIPPPFQSPERFDARTNYLAPLAAGGPLVIDPEAKMPFAADGFEQTILVVEADETHAVPWTKPEEFPFDAAAPRRGLGALRDDGFFAVLGKGKVHVVTDDIDEATVASFFLIAKERKPVDALAATRPLPESVDAAPANVKPLEPLLPQDRPTGAAARQAGSGAPSDDSTSAAALEVVPEETAASGASSPGSAASSEPPVNDFSGRLPIPDEDALKAARKDVRDLFQQRFKDAKTAKDRAAIAVEILRQIEGVGEDLGARYVMLRAALDIASSHGDIKSARKAADQLTTRYRVDPVDVPLEAIRALGGSLGAYEKKPRSELARWAKDVCDTAYALDDFAGAREAYQVALSLARSAEDRDVLRQVMEHYRKIEEAKRQFAQVSNVMKVLDHSPDDPNANLAVGRYFCFVKGEWDRGLPFLLKGSDRRLAELAALDLALPASPELQADLGDAWWTLAEDHREPQKQKLKERSAHWYRQAAVHLPNGLSKVKAELRLKELQRESPEKNLPTFRFREED